MFKLIFLLLPFFPATEKPLPVLPTKTAYVNKALMLQLINEVRQSGCRCGDTYYYPVAPLTWNDKLEKAASLHSADMYQRNYFSHASQDGKKGGARLDEAGYHWKTFGENIAMGYRNEVDVVEGWLQSPGHCKNIMNKDFKEMGVARVGNYWTQEFGRR